MSDKVYAVQFRSMRTAIHSIALFDLKSAANEFFSIINETEEMPDDHEFDDSRFVAIKEINFRDVPMYWPENHEPDGWAIIYVNNPAGNVPDVFGY